MADNKKTDLLCRYLYGIYAATMPMQMMTFTAMLLGGIAMLAAVVITYNQQASAAGTIYETHLMWMKRTFWIGAGIYLPVAVIIAAAIIYPNIDQTRMMEAMYSGQAADMQALMDILKEDNAKLTLTIGAATMGPFLVWWLWRCWKGFKALKDGKPVDNIMSWL